MMVIPESPFALHGEAGFLAALERRLDDRDHAVVVVAEGAGQHLFETNGSASVDASGIVRLHDIGQRLRQEVLDYFAVRGRPVDLKYIDSSYIIRSVPPSTADQLLCDDPAGRAVHAAMSGRTDTMISRLTYAFIYVRSQRLVLAAGRLILRASSGHRSSPPRNSLRDSPPLTVRDCRTVRDPIRCGDVEHDQPGLILDSERACRAKRFVRVLRKVGGEENGSKRLHGNSPH